jgi:hypothetical protein
VQYIEEIVEQDEAFEDNVATAVWSVLSGIQDYISEALKEPWPPNQSAPRELPVPEVGIAGGFIRAWYGSEKSPILALDPIPIPPSS